MFNISNLAVPAVVIAVSLLAAPPSAHGQQPTEGAAPTSGARMTGGRAAMPSPGLSAGQNRTLLSRSRTMLPSPSVASPRVVPGGPGAFGGGVPTRTTWTSGFGSGERTVAETRCGVPRETDGVSVNGSYIDDRFRLKFHIGSGYDGTDRCSKRDRWCGTTCNTCCDPCTGSRTCRYPWVWSWGWGWYDTPYVVYSGPWYGTDPFVTQGQATPSASAAPAAAPSASQAPREPTLIERADEAWQTGRPDVAAGLLKEYLRAAPEDADALRYLSLTMIDQGRLEEGVALMAMAYQKLPQLASRPLPAPAIPGGREAMRRRVNALSGLANRTRTASAWMTLAVLIQGEGRTDVARRILQRATAAGLSGAAATELQAALGD